MKGVLKNAFAWKHKKSGAAAPPGDAKPADPRANPALQAELRKEVQQRGAELKALLEPLCGSDQPKLRQIGVELEKQLAAALVLAKEDPWKALEQLNALVPKAKLAASNVTLQPVQPVGSGPRIGAQRGAPPNGSEAWAKVMLALQSALAAAEQHGNPEHAAFLRRFQELSKSARDDYPAATREGEKLAQEIAGAEKAIEGDLARARAQVIDACKGVTSLRDAIKKARGIPDDLLTGVERRHTETLALQDAGNLAAYAAALPVIEGTRAELADVLKNAAQLPLQKKRLEEGKKKLEGSLVKDHQGQAAALLLKELEELDKTWKTQTPAEAVAAANAFLTKVAKLENDATEIKNLRATGKLESAAVQKLFVQLDAQMARATMNRAVQQKTYDGELRGRLAGAQQALQSEKVETVKSAFKVFEEITKKAEGYLHGLDPELLLADQEKALAARQLKTRQAEQWKNSYKLFKEQLDVLRDAVGKANGDRQELEQIEKLGKKADESAKKSAFEAALSQLELARTQLVTLLKDPQGTKPSSKKALRELDTRWKHAVDGYRKSLTDLGAKLREVQARAGGDYPDLGVTIGDIGKLATLFRAEAFSAHIAVLSSEEPRAAEDAKAGRETALRTLRRYQELIAKDPLLHHVALNPFVPGTLTGVYKVLRDLDLNLQRCV